MAETWTDEQKRMYFLDALIARGEVLRYCVLDEQKNEKFLAITRKHGVNLSDPACLLPLMEKFDPVSLARELDCSSRYVEGMLSAVIGKLKYWKAQITTVETAAKPKTIKPLEAEGMPRLLGKMPKRAGENADAHLYVQGSLF